MKSKGIKVYIGAYYTRKMEVVTAAYELESLGIQVVSTWHKEHQNPSTGLRDCSESFLRRTAKRDRDELDKATHFVMLTLDPHAPFVRGGVCWENGYADGKGKRITIVGPRQHIFHYLSGVKEVETWDQAKAWLVKENNGKNNA